MCESGDFDQWLLSAHCFPCQGHRQAQMVGFWPEEGRREVWELIGWLWWVTVVGWPREVQGCTKNRQSLRTGTEPIVTWTNSG